MNRLTLTFSFLLFIVLPASAREFTKPPGIELRNEISYVAETVLTQKSFDKDKQQWTLTFKLLNNIHNQSDATIQINVEHSIASMLGTEKNYVIAYQNHRKAKVDGVKRYLPIKGGSTLISVQGAEPAIFANHPLLIKQLKTNPELAQSDPQKLLNNIIQGIQVSDPKIQTFFVRELINWNGLLQQMNSTQKEILLKVFLNPNTSAESLIAFIENRQDLHQALGVELMVEKVTLLLTHMPVTIDQQPSVSTLVFEALNFLKNKQSKNWDLNHRWLRSDNPSITEIASSQLHKIDAQKAYQAIQNRLLETNLNETTERVLKRHLKKHPQTP